MVWEDGTQPQGVAVASAQYRQDAAAALGRVRPTPGRELWRERRRLSSLADTTRANGSIGAPGNAKYSGYAPVTKAAWRHWLRSRYSSEAELARCVERRHRQFRHGRTAYARGASHQPWRHLSVSPQRNDHIVDFNRFQQEAMADCVLDLARSVRRASEGRKLSVFFYGYVFEFTAAIHRARPSAGHYGLRRVLDSPDIDILCSPISYNDRGLGESAPVDDRGRVGRRLPESSGSMKTTRRPTSVPAPSPATPSGWILSRARTTSCLRNVGQEACRNFATWWMDLGGTGWFNDRRLWDTMKSHWKPSTIRSPLSRGAYLSAHCCSRRRRLDDVGR
jgi:beta-galactosidase